MELAHHVIRILILALNFHVLTLLILDPEKLPNISWDGKKESTTIKQARNNNDDDDDGYNIL